MFLQCMYVCMYVHIWKLFRLKSIKCLSFYFDLGTEASAQPPTPVPLAKTMVTLTLTNNDSVFADIRNLSIEKLGSYMQEKVYKWIYTCMYVCMFVSMHFIYILHACIYVLYMYVFSTVCMYVCMYLCMYVLLCINQRGIHTIFIERRRSYPYLQYLISVCIYACVCMYTSPVLIVNRRFIFESATQPSERIRMLPWPRYTTSSRRCPSWPRTTNLWTNTSTSLLSSRSQIIFELQLFLL